MNKPSNERQCIRCRHYYITHDTALPYGCNALHFKSRNAPWREVLAASGTPCQYFSPKPHKMRG